MTTLWMAPCTYAGVTAIALEEAAQAQLEMENPAFVPPKIG